MRGCYAAATSLGMCEVGEILTFIYLAYIRRCYATATLQILRTLGRPAAAGMKLTEIHILAIWGLGEVGGD